MSSSQPGEGCSRQREQHVKARGWESSKKPVGAQRVGEGSTGGGWRGCRGPGHAGQDQVEDWGAQHTRQCRRTKEGALGDILE